MTTLRVCRVSELPPGARRIVNAGRYSVGVFNVNGRFHALLNRCPHKAAPLCLGNVKGWVTAREPYQFEIEREGEILQCPWHGWEFDITTGRSFFNPHRMRVRSYEVTLEPAPDEVDSVATFPVTVEDQFVVLHVP